jgi:branched-chain amino acid transport system substrate-binding protein
VGLIDSAITAVKGDLTNKEGMRKEMEKADFKSVRGPFKYGNNHIPIQNFYLVDAAKNADGSYALHTVTTIVKNDQDKFHDKCPMK